MTAAEPTDLPGRVLHAGRACSSPRSASAPLMRSRSNTTWCTRASRTSMSRAHVLDQALEGLDPGVVDAEHHLAVDDQLPGCVAERPGVRVDEWRLEPVTTRLGSHSASS